MYLIPKTLSIRNPPKKQRITLGQEYQAYSCMKLAVFRFRSWYRKCIRCVMVLRFTNKTTLVESEQSGGSMNK